MSECQVEERALRECGGEAVAALGYAAVALPRRDRAATTEDAAAGAAGRGTGYLACCFQEDRQRTQGTAPR